MKLIKKTLLLPITQDNELLIQDRRGHKPPPWGFFGGSIEGDETPTEAVIRETKEELDVDLELNEIEYQGEFPGSERDGLMYINHVFTWKFDGDLTKLTLLEGKDMKLLAFKEAKELISMKPDKHIIQECLLD